MRILYISTDAHQERSNAANIHTMSLTTNLISLHNRLCLVISGNREELIHYHQSDLITLPFRPLNGGFLNRLYSLFYNNYLLFRGIHKYRFRFDTIYERHNLGFFASTILSKLKHIPLVYEVNGIPDEESFIAHSITNVVVKRLINIVCGLELRAAKSIIVQTPELQSILKNRFHLNNIGIVDNGTDFLRAHKQRRHQNRLFTVSFVGGLGEFHNLGQVLDILTDTTIEFEFLVIGDGKYRPSYLERYGNDKRFRFIGEVNHSDVEEYITKSDLCIASYNLKLEVFNTYGFYFCPIKLLEYSSLGKPTIIYGYRNSIINRFEKMNCCIVVNNRQDLLNAMTGLMNNRKQLDEMSTNAAKASNYYSWGRAAKETGNILAHAISSTEE